jgi:large subunit ribosomal protein L24
MNFSTNFKASTNPRKQRLYVYHAPLHIKSAMLASHLSKELRQKVGKRALRVRVGDKIIVMTGQHRKKTGKVERVDVGRQAVFVAGIERQRKDGSKAAYPLHPSNLVITELVEDRRRYNKQRKAPKAAPAVAKTAPKPMPAVKTTPQPSQQRAPISAPSQSKPSTTKVSP